MIRNKLLLIASLLSISEVMAIIDCEDSSSESKSTSRIEQKSACLSKGSAKLLKQISEGSKSSTALRAELDRANESMNRLEQQARARTTLCGRWCWFICCFPRFHYAFENKARLDLECDKFSRIELAARTSLQADGFDFGAASNLVKQAKAGSSILDLQASREDSQRPT